MPDSTTSSLQTLDHAKIRRDLDDCQRALSAWWDGPETTGMEQTLHTAIGRRSEWGGGMTPAVAQQQIAQAEQRVKQAGQQYVMARHALEEARAALQLARLNAQGEFDPNHDDGLEVGYYSVRRRCTAVGSRGPWQWVTT